MELLKIIIQHYSSAKTYKWAKLESCAKDINKYKSGTYYKGKWFQIKRGEIYIAYKEEGFHNKHGEALAQVGCPVPGGTQGQAGGALST